LCLQWVRICRIVGVSEWPSPADDNIYSRSEYRDNNLTVRSLNAARRPVTGVTGREWTLEGGASQPGEFLAEKKRSIFVTRYPAGSGLRQLFSSRWYRCRPA